MEARRDSLYEFQARFVAAMANPKRLEILDQLGGGQRTVSDLFALVDLPHATTSQHLAVLREAGVVAARRCGNFVFSRVADPRVTVACRAMAEAVLSIVPSEQERPRPILGLAGRPRRTAEARA